MKKLLIVVCVTLCLSVQQRAWARLGETRAELMTRYGKVESESNGPFGELSLTFYKGGFCITADLIGQKTVNLVIQKLDKSAISEAEMAALLSDNANGQQWKKGAVPDYWMRTDGAVAVGGGKTISFSTPEWLSKSKPSSGKNNLSGF